MEGKRKWEVWESKKNRKKMRNRERLDWECRKIESLWESEGEREKLGERVKVSEWERYTETI